MSGETGANEALADDPLVKIAIELARELGEVAADSEVAGHPNDRLIAELEAAGLTKLTVPKSRGGHQAPVATVSRVIEELARGCGSTSFVASVYNAIGWWTCLFPDAAQEEVFSSDNPKAFGVFNPGGMATKVEGGYTLEGRWPFCSGQQHAGWGVLFAVRMTDDGIPEVGLYLVPRSAMKSADDWNVTGLCATGSDTLILEETFIPDHRSLQLNDILEGNFSSTLANTDPYYQTAFMPFTFGTFVGTPLGVAEAAFDIFADRIQKRGITYTLYLKQADAAITHYQMAEARMKIDEARFHAERLTSLASANSQDLDELTRARCRADMGWEIRLCREAVDIIQSAAGVQAIHRSQPLQRIVRDMQALSVHAFFLPTTNAELYGRILSGVDAGVPFV